MKKSLQLFACFLCLSLFASISSLDAALPPLYATLNEYKSLLNDQELADKLGSAESIRDIKRTESGFIVTGNRYSLHVDLIYEPQNHPGPAKFHFVFHELQPVK